MATDALERRARQIRARAAVRAWEYRQRHTAKGTWFRLRRALADAKECWVLTDDAVGELVAEGLEPLPVGAELEPAKRIFVLPAERLATLTGRRQIRGGLTADLLAAANLGLVPFVRVR